MHSSMTTPNEFVERATCALSEELYIEAFDEILGALELALAKTKELDTDSNSSGTLPFEVSELMNWAKLAQTTTTHLVPPEDTLASIRLVDILLQLASHYLVVPPENVESEYSDGIWKVALHGITEFVQNLVRMLMEDAQSSTGSSTTAPIDDCLPALEATSSYHLSQPMDSGSIPIDSDSENRPVLGKVVDVGVDQVPSSLEVLPQQHALSLAIEYQDIVIAFEKRLHKGRWNTAVEEALVLQSQLMEMNGNFVKAIALKRSALAICAKLHGNEGERVLDRTRQLSESLILAGRYIEAEEVVKQVLLLEEKLLQSHAAEEGAASREIAGASNASKEAKENIAISLGRLAEITLSLSKFEEAEKWQRRALQVSRQLHGETSEQVAGDLHNLAAILAHAGKPAEARQVGLEALATAQRCFPADSPLVKQYKEWWERGGALNEMPAERAEHQEADVA